MCFGCSKEQSHGDGSFEYPKRATTYVFGEERAGCIALFVFLVSRDCCVALLHNVVFPDHTRYFWLENKKNNYQIHAQH